jgi:hypothetical protein
MNQVPDITADKYRTSYDPTVGLFLSLKHLKCKGMGIGAERDCRSLDVSYWKFKQSGPYAGSVHISPSSGSELKLIEDFPKFDDSPDFPQIASRMTDSKLVNISMYYPLSRELWDFTIHYKSHGLIVDQEAESLLADGRVSPKISNPWEYEDREVSVYRPPRQVVKLSDGKWVTKPL